MKGIRNVVYMSLMLGLLVYAIPHLKMGGGWSVSTVFGITWLVFALIIISAHLHVILGVDENTQEELRRIRVMKRLQFERKLQGFRGPFLPMK